jgi:hypothetical protein
MNDGAATPTGGPYAWYRLFVWLSPTSLSGDRFENAHALCSMLDQAGRELEANA